MQGRILDGFRFRLYDESRVSLLIYTVNLVHALISGTEDSVSKSVDKEKLGWGLYNKTEC